MFHIQILTEVSPHSKSSAARHAGSSPARGTMIAARRASRVACKQWYTVYDAALAFCEGNAMNAYRFPSREFLQAVPVVDGGSEFYPGDGVASWRIRTVWVLDRVGCGGGTMRVEHS